MTKQTTGAYPKGWYPDALIPLDEESAFDVPLGQNQGLWVTVKVPKGQTPGDYEGRLTIKADEQTMTVPITFRVWDFELEDAPHTQTAFAVWNDQVAYYHGVKKDTPEYWELIENYYWYQTEFRLPPDDLPIPEDDVDQYITLAEPFLSDPKVNSFRIPYYDGNLQKTKEMVDKLRDKGWLDKGYFYIGHLIDEPSPPMYERVRQISEELKTIAPDVKHVVTHEPVAELTGYVNTWAPALYKYDRSSAMERQAAGDHVWWYTSVSTKHPFPSYHTDDDLLGARLLSWMQREHKVEGNLFWSTTIFRKYDETQYIDRDVWSDPQAFPRANGDGYLLYPGKDLGINGPVSTIRLHAIREGMEDYEYLWLFEKRMKETASAIGLTSFDADAAMKPIYDRLFQSLNRYAEKPELLLQVRREIAEQIVALQQNPMSLVTAEATGDLQQQLTVYAEAGATVKIDGQPLQPAEQNEHYDLYRQTIDLHFGLNEKQLTVSKNGAEKQQTIVLVGKEPAPPEFKIALNYAETDNDLSRWQANKVSLSLSEQHATQGNRSMKAEYLPGAEFPNISLIEAGEGFRSADWSRYVTFNFDVYNPNDVPVLFFVNFEDQAGQKNDTHPVTVTAKSRSSVNIPLADLGNLDLTQMLGVELWMQEQNSPVPVYFDNFHFVANEPLPPQDMSYQMLPKISASDIQIDGEPSEVIWQLDQEYPYTIVGTTENTGKFGLLWNEQYLYAAFEITDEDVREPSRPAAPWEDDSVELFIDGDLIRGPRNEHAPQYTVRFQDDQVFLNGAPSSATAGIIQQSQRTDTGYALEMAIPWDVIGVQPQAGKTIGITSHVNDDDVRENVQSYGVIGYTAQGLGDVKSTENWKEFILIDEQPLDGEMVMENVVFTDLERRKELTSLKRTDSVLAAAAVENRRKQAQHITFAVGLYNHKDELKQIALVEKMLEPGQREVFRAGFVLANRANGNKVKVSVWDSFSGKQPLVPDVVF